MAAPDDRAPARTRRLEAGRYFHNDLVTGDWFETGPLTIEDSHIDEFARLTGDVFGVHMDDAFARQLGFPRRVAHGLLVLSLVDGLKNRCAVELAAIASLGWDWTFAAPVLIGDTIRATVTVAKSRTTTSPGKGIVALWFEVTNQDGVRVQQGFNRLMMQRRTDA